MSGSALESRRQPPIGIDLGTTYSAIAFLDDTGRPTTIANDVGELLTPSAITFDADNVVVGKEAIKSAVFEPEVFADCFKRDMGRLSFRRAIESKEVPPEVLSAFVLERLRLDAQCRVGPIRDVVITVPAFFDESRRRATQDAGRLAGLQVLDIINEPTAAAIAFGYYRARMRSAEQDDSELIENVLVYDLGGGTFDVSVLRMQGTKIQTLATDGDVQLGGKDFDERLVSHFAESFIAAHGIDPRSDPHDAVQLWMDAQQAKHTLSERTKAIVPCMHAGIRMKIDLSRAEFEQLTSDLLHRTETTTQLVLRQAKLDWTAIDHVLLVGGSSRMPMVVEMLRRISGKEPNRSMSPDEVVAHGAAIYAATLMGEQPGNVRPDLDVVNVNSHSLGIIGLDRSTNRRQNVIIIPKNTALPCRAVRRFATANNDQRSVKVPIVEGESEMPEHCIALGECIVRNLPPGLPKNTAVEVEYSYAANGRISVLARVPSVRQSAVVDIEHGGPKGMADLETWRRRLCQLTPAEPSSHNHGPNNRNIDSPISAGAAGMSRLDELTTRLGEHALKCDVPASLRKHQLAAKNALRESAATSARRRELEKTRTQAVGQSEIIRATADLSQANTDVQQATTLAKFALLHLGRECITANYWPAGAEKLEPQIREEQQRTGKT